MEYKIISTQPSLTARTEELETLVNKAISEGWKPTGGLVLMQIPQRIPGAYLVQLAQAVIK